MRAWARTVLTGAVVGILAAGPAGAQTAPSADAAAVARTFREAQTAAAGHKGMEIARLLSSDTLDRASQIRSAAAAEGDGQIDTLDASGRFAAFGLRHYLTPQEIGRMDVPSLLRYGLQRGWLGGRLIDSARLGPVEVDGDRATAPLIVNGRRQLVPASFVKENGAWHIDMGPAIMLGDALLGATIASSGQPEDQAINGLLGRAISRASGIDPTN